MHTRLTVRDIVLEFGHPSLGRLPRDHRTGGLTPAPFRKTASMADVPLRLLKQFEKWPGAPSVSGRSAVVSGAVQAEIPFGGVALIGLFAKPFTEGLPLYGIRMSSSEEFGFAGVKPGTYRLMTTSVSWGMQAEDILIPETTLRFVRRGRSLSAAALSFLNSECCFAPPSRMLSLPLLMANFLKRLQTNAPG